MAVGDVVCVGVTSGELIATRFLRDLGDVRSAWLAGVLEFGRGTSGGMSCTSI